MISLSLSECTAASCLCHTSQYLLALITAWCHRSGSNAAQHSAVSPPPVPVRSEVNYKVLHVCYKRLTPSSSVSDKCSPAVFAGKMRAAHANTQSSRSSKNTSPLALMYMYIMYLHTATPAIIYTVWHYIQPTPDLVPSAFRSWEPWPASAVYMHTSTQRLNWPLPVEEVPASLLCVLSHWPRDGWYSIHGHRKGKHSGTAGKKWTSLFWGCFPW